MTSASVCIKSLFIIAFPWTLSRVCEYILHKNIVWIEKTMPKNKWAPTIILILVLKDIACILFGLASYLAEPINGLLSLTYGITLFLLFTSTVAYLGLHDMDTGLILRVIATISLSITSFLYWRVDILAGIMTSISTFIACLSIIVLNSKRNAERQMCLLLTLLLTICVGQSICVKSSINQSLEKLHHLLSFQDLAIFVGFPMMIFRACEFLSIAQMNWFRNLKKPGYMESKWIIMTILDVNILLRGAAAYIIFHNFDWHPSLYLYFVSLALTFSCYPIYFIGHYFKMGLVFRILNMLTSLACFVYFCYLDMIAGLLSIPYALVSMVLARTAYLLYKTNVIEKDI